MAPLSLDDPGVRERLDREGMLAHLQAIPEQCDLGWRRGIEAAIPGGYADVKAVVVAGMGGSAMGADLVRAIVQDRLPVPMQVVRDYELPAFVDDRTLVVLSSYSGTTGETLAAFRDATDREAKLVALGGGGRLLDEIDGPAGRIQTRGMPRAAMAESMMLLLGIMQAAGLVDGMKDSAERLPGLAAEQVRKFDVGVPEADNPAKQLARSLAGRLPVVVGSAVLGPVAGRWKAQFNENAEQWAVIDELPEFNHNTIQGIGLPAAAADLLHVLVLTAGVDGSRTRRQGRFGGQLVEETGIPVMFVEAEGDDRLSQAMSLVILGDFVSYYLAMLNEVDPTGIPRIAELKARMAAEA